MGKNLEFYSWDIDWVKCEHNYTVSASIIIILYCKCEHNYTVSASIIILLVRA